MSGNISDHASQHDDASNDEYAATWTTEDLRFASFWVHERVLPLFGFIQRWGNTITDWPTDKQHIVDAINQVFPVLELLKVEYPEKATNDIESTLLNLWYGYTHVLALVSSEWASVYIHDSYKPIPVDPGFCMPDITPIEIEGTMVPLDKPATATMPQDVLSRLRDCRRQDAGKSSQPGMGSIVFFSFWILTQVLAATPSRPKIIDSPPKLLSSPIKHSLKGSADEIADNGSPKADPPPPKSKRTHQSEVQLLTGNKEGAETVYHSKPATWSPGQPLTSGTSKQAPVSKPASKRKVVEKAVEKPAEPKPAKTAEPEVPKLAKAMSPIHISDDDSSEDAEGEEDVDSDRDVDMKEVKPSGSRPRVRVVKSLNAIGNDKKEKAASLADINAAALGKVVEEILKKRQSNHKATGGAQFNISTDGQQDLLTELENSIQIANDARHVADKAARRIVRCFALFGLNTLVVVDKFGPATLRESFTDETLSAVIDYFNGVIDQHNKMLGESATLLADEWCPRLAASDLVDASTFSVIGTSAFKFVNRKDKGKAKAG
ncbi:hypothetical protein K438DRAFT_1765881 [Mycena galopus ATCC 62051]|nr:hypothetical protein K438DRAFT_1765881 [Mycena galopus ATCC 62051]